MSLNAECIVAALRAIVIAATCAAAAAVIEPCLRSMTHSMKRTAWSFMIIVLLTPPILPGYAFADFAVARLNHPAQSELVYAAMMILRLIPLAIIIRHLVSGTTTPEAMHCTRLLARNRRSFSAALSMAAMRLRESAGSAGLAVVLVFMLAFTEFELASFLSVPHWTVNLFDTQVGGYSLEDSLHLARLPFVTCAAVVLAGFWSLSRARWNPNRTSIVTASSHVLRSAFVWASLALAFVVITLIPGFVITRHTLATAPTMFMHFGLSREMLSSILLAVAATIAACSVTCLACRDPKRVFTRSTRMLIALLVLPGLVGPLLLALLVQRAFQQPPLNGIYDTPLPMLLTHCFYLLPFTLLLRLVFQRSRPGSPDHAAKLLQQRKALKGYAGKLRWSLGLRNGYWLAAIAFCLAYFDVTISSILAPTAMTPLMPRLYNFMHYGQSAVLSAMIFVSFVAPVLIIGGALPLWRRIAIRYD